MSLGLGSGSAFIKTPILQTRVLADTRGIHYFFLKNVSSVLYSIISITFVNQHVAKELKFPPMQCFQMEQFLFFFVCHES